MRVQKSVEPGGDKSAPARVARPTAAQRVPSRLDAAPMTPTTMLSLQRTVGNAAVAQMAARDRQQHGADCGHQRSEPSAVQRSPVVQRVQGDMDLHFRTKTLKAGSVVFKGGNWSDGAALIAAAKTYTTNGEWGACYLGSPANVSVGYMEEQQNKLLQVTLKRDITLLEIYGATADDGSVGGEEKAAMVKKERNYAPDKYLMDSIKGDGYDGAFMNADADGSGKEVILHWAVVGDACEAVAAAKQPRWNKMGYFEELSDSE